MFCVLIVISVVLPRTWTSVCPQTSSFLFLWACRLVRLFVYPLVGLFLLLFVGELARTRLSLRQEPRDQVKSTPGVPGHAHSLLRYSSPINSNIFDFRVASWSSATSIPSGSLAACDRKLADDCVINMEAVITSAVEESAGLARTERLQGLCLDVIKGNNLTQCFLNATNSCTDVDSVTPTEVIQRWEKVMQDLYSLCDGACPNFLEKTVNITQCTGLIRFDSLYDSSYSVFCCDNLDKAMTNLESCKTYVTSLPDDLEEACVSYQKFKSCVEMSEVPVACPMFSSLMEVLYPQHIFGLYEQNCNTTQLTGNMADQCGSVGVARIDHCIRIFALAWPSNHKDETFSKQQCKYAMSRAFRVFPLCKFKKALPVEHKEKEEPDVADEGAVSAYGREWDTCIW
ncbi:hypothetical protein ElyMa_006820100 [Elysia marginata]|uniref:DUF19 domain-containing protein n=1 Tax=Elysia marginata TaxID=1093978 RepID=A0AAV4J7P9_9GAST|nr:hypothetical protein ElyMa_006820100 [Elysia marginata]